MSDFYKEMQAVATDVIGEFKQGVAQYVVVTPGAGPPDNPGEPTEITHTVNSVVRGVAFKYIDGTTIVSTDLQITFSGDQPFVPNIRDFIIVDGVRYKIVKSVAKPAAGTPVAYTIIFRK